MTTMNGYSPRVRKKKKVRNRLIVTQRLMGLGLLVISAIVILIASTGKTIEDRDATVVVFTLPLGLYMLFCKDVVITP